MTALELTTTRTIKAPAKAVFDAWLDPAMLTRFMLPGEGVSVPSAETDPRAGGKFLIIMKAGDKEMPHGGTYKEITRHSRLVFTWKGPHSVDDSTVTLTFAETDAGTQVTLHQIRFASEESRDNHRKGWSAILTALDAAVARQAA